jgi:hypothetical protein
LFFLLFLHLDVIVTLGTIAQLVEQWTENPCVPGSIPGGTTRRAAKSGSFLLSGLVLQLLGCNSAFAEF